MVLAHGAVDRSSPPPALFDDSLADRIASVERRLAAVVAAARGQTYDPLRGFLARPGKRVRPRIALVCGEAIGATVDDARDVAVLVELIHAFTLIHDDIEDAAAERRGQPSLHVEHGVPIALNAGDALYTLAWRTLLELDREPRQLVALGRLFARALQRTVEGQGDDLAWSAARRVDVDESEYLQMIVNKTGALLGLACESVALLADAPYRGALRRYGEHFGVAFQLRDDVLALTAPPAQTGKPSEDLALGKCTLALIHGRRSCSSAERTRLDRAFAAGQVAEVRSLLEAHGALEYADTAAKGFAAVARQQLLALPDTPARDTLMWLADFAAARLR